jgi:signal peptidase I
VADQVETDNTGKELRRQRKQRRMVISSLFNWIILLLIGAILLVNLFTHVLLVVRYSGNAMEPSLRSGQTLVVQRTRQVQEGDIIVFYFNNQILIRRVICAGGKQIQVNQDGTVLVNMQQVEEPYVQEPSIGQCNLSFPFHVRTGCVFVMGDNRAISMDSRLEEIGPIPLDRVIGKVLFAF